MSRKFFGYVWLAFFLGGAPFAWCQEPLSLVELRGRPTEIKALQRYVFGASRVGWDLLEAKLRNPLQREREEAERILMEILRSPLKSTVDARILACRGLRFVSRPGENTESGENSGVQYLISLIRDSRLSAEACRALQEKEADGINPALREALPLAEINLKRQIMTTLGRRRDREAVPSIVALARGIDDADIRDIAIQVLGQIGGREAIEALEQFDFGMRHESEREHATLAAAARSLGLSEEDEKAGLAALRRLTVKARLNMVRLGALYEWAAHDQSQRPALCRQALTSREDSLLEIAPQIFELLELEDVRSLYASFFDDLGMPAQTVLVERWKPEYGEADKIRALSVNLGIADGLRRAAQRAVDRFQE